MEDVEKVLVSVAFANLNGLTALEASLKPIAQKATLFIGIRNGITSVQALQKSLDIGCTVYVVDTGKPSIVFHPKIYLARSSNESRVIVGSANLTGGGLRSNIEASLMISNHLEMVDEWERIIENLPNQYPDNVYEVPNSQSIQDLLEDGVIVDENVVITPRFTGKSTNVPKRNTPVISLTTSSGTRIPRRATPTQGSANRLATQSVSAFDLVWTSNPLTERSLNIPTNQSTNPTGSMLFSKGTVLGIDHRHYFKDEVFSNVQWSIDPQSPHMERADVLFQLIVRGVDYGEFNLRVSHDTRTSTPTYRQRNSMTQLHWGTARQFIARQELLGDTLYLYRENMRGQRFIIIID